MHIFHKSSDFCVVRYAPMQLHHRTKVIIYLDLKLRDLLPATLLDIESIYIAINITSVNLVICSQLRYRTLKVFNHFLGIGTFMYH